MNPEQVDDNGLASIDDSAALAEIQKAFDRIDSIQDGNDKQKKEVVGEREEEKQEEIEDPEPEEEVTEEVTEYEEEEIEAPKKEKKGDKYRKLQNDKYRAIAEKEALAARVSQLEEMLNDSLNSGTYHYGKNVYGDLERARAKKAYAYEQGDAKLAVEADEELITALHAVKDLEKWTTQLDSNKNTKVPQKVPSQHSVGPTITPEVAHELTMDWLDSHPYLQPSSRNYDEKLSQNVADYANRLDYDLNRKGQSHLIYSDAYFDKLDKYVGSLTRKPVDVAKNIESHAGVSGVRSSAGTTQSVTRKSPTHIVLNANEKRMASEMGVSEKDWLKYKIDELKRGKK